MGHPWHPADIQALVKKRGGTFTSIAKDNGLAVGVPLQALKRWCYSGEQAVAEFVGIPAHELWPDRYDADGYPLHPRVRKKMFNALKASNPRQNAGVV